MAERRPPRAEEFIMGTTSDHAAGVEEATERVRQLSEQVAAQARENGLAWLEGYERVLKNLLDFEEQAAKGTGTEWVAQLASTHANFVRETTEVFFGSLREHTKD
jgi:hypothetical protein